MLLFCENGIWSKVENAIPHEQHNIAWLSLIKWANLVISMSHYGLKLHSHQEQPTKPNQPTNQQQLLTIRRYSLDAINSIDDNDYNTHQVPPFSECDQPLNQKSQLQFCILLNIDSWSYILYSKLVLNRPSKLNWIHAAIVTAAATMRGKEDGVLLLLLLSTLNFTQNERERTRAIIYLRQLSPKVLNYLLLYFNPANEPS